MPPSPKLYVRHRRDRRLYGAYLRHIRRPKWRSYTSTKYDPDVPLATPSFGNAIAWIRRNRHVISGVILLLKLYPHVIRDDSLNSLWEFIEPYLSVCALNTTRRSSSDSDLSVTCRSVLSTPTFVEISFPVTPVPKLTTSSGCYGNSTRLARSDNSLHKDNNNLKSPHWRRDVISLSTLPASSCLSVSENKYKNGCISPIVSHEPHRLAPPGVPLSPVSRYIQQQQQHHHDHEQQQQRQRHEARPASSSRSSTPEVSQMLPPVRTIKNRTVARLDASRQREFPQTRPHLHPHISPPTQSKEAVKVLSRSSSEECSQYDLYTPTRYLITRSNSLNQLKLVNWPQADEEVTNDDSVNVDYLSEDSELSESSYLLNNENGDIDLWSDTPIEGVEGELN
ncbi:hypothetical protein LSH36_286g02011 [Paralvinella palmiformis]|uniref:Uncharacterized protein n=1 Tax=Paralvinella palmiformis TaxID=53620 RepID=A0AAD9JJT8_9ANNE|nr:hypothetical protein LSH36_286g02011 [Paralvinella palmiformis]